MLRALSPNFTSFLAFHLHLGARILAEQDGVADLDVKVAQLAAVEQLAVAHGQYGPADRFFRHVIRDHDPAGGHLFFLDALHDDAIMQRTKFHFRISQ
jgi:hypothetical protein